MNRRPTEKQTEILAAIAAGRDRSAVIMAIRPQQAGAIMDGAKKWEFRRKSLPDTVRTVLVYRSGRADSRGVIGAMTVLGQDAQSCWSWGAGPCLRGYGHTKPDPRYGISINDLADYSDPECGSLSAVVTGIAVKVAEVYPEPVPLAAFGIASAPRTWVYAPAGWRTATVVSAADRK